MEITLVPEKILPIYPYEDMSNIMYILATHQCTCKNDYLLLSFLHLPERSDGKKLGFRYQASKKI